MRPSTSLAPPSQSRSTNGSPSSSVRMSPITRSSPPSPNLNQQRLLSSQSPSNSLQLPSAPGYHSPAPPAASRSPRALQRQFSIQPPPSPPSVSPVPYGQLSHYYHPPSPTISSYPEPPAHYYPSFSPSLSPHSFRVRSPSPAIPITSPHFPYPHFTISSASSPTSFQPHPLSLRAPPSSPCSFQTNRSISPSASSASVSPRPPFLPTSLSSPSSPHPAYTHPALSRTSQRSISLQPYPAQLPSSKAHQPPQQPQPPSKSSLRQQSSSTATTTSNSFTPNHHHIANVPNTHHLQQSQLTTPSTAGIKSPPTPKSTISAKPVSGQIIGSFTPQDSNGRCKTYCRELIAFLFSHLGLCLLLIGYMLMGAAIFQELESDPTAHLRIPQQAIELQNETLTRLFAKVRHLSVFADEKITEVQLAGELNAVLADYTRRMVEHIGDGYDPNAVTGNGNKWDFFGAFLYSLTIITTIGYGHIAPSRAETRIVTIVYAIFGIPLMLLYLTNIGGILAQSFRYIYTRLTHLICSGRMRQRRRAQLYRQQTQRRRLQQKSLSNPLTLAGASGTIGGPSRHITQIRPSASSHSLHHTGRSSNKRTGDPFELRRLDLRDSGAGDGGLMDSVIVSGNSVSGGNIERYEKVHVPITLCLLILIAYVTGGGLVFANWENWSRIEGAYFCFITLSTIGFGDYVPGKYVNKQVNFIMCSIYILVGLALIAMCFNLMQEGVKHKFHTLVRKIGVLKDKYADQDDQLSDSDID